MVPIAVVEEHRAYHEHTRIQSEPCPTETRAMDDECVPAAERHSGRLSVADHRDGCGWERLRATTLPASVVTPAKDQKGNQPTSEGRGANGETSSESFSHTAAPPLPDPVLCRTVGTRYRHRSETVGAKDDATATGSQTRVTVEVADRANRSITDVERQQ
jgi:hypothetical protein